jgi:hypothetical protein
MEEHLMSALPVGQGFCNDLTVRGQEARRSCRLPMLYGLLLVGSLGGLTGCRSTAGRSANAAPAAAHVALPAVPNVTAVTPDGIQFESVAKSRGLAFEWPRQARPLRNLEAFGCGCAFLDYDNDGWQDILLVSGDRVSLFHNKGNGEFEDVSAEAGFSSLTRGLSDAKGRWTGCAVGDYDGDGRLDILLTGYRRLALLRNMDGKRFEDRTVEAGLSPTNEQHWGSSAGFMDLDGSGRLSLVITNYVVFNAHEPQYCEIRPGVQSGCPPDRYRPEFDEVWQNVGQGRFKNVSALAGMKNTNGKGLVVAFTDLDDDGKIDFYLGNDGTPAEMMHNLGGMRFENVGVKSGAAYGAQGRAIAAMGADWADYDRDGRLDLAVSAFSNEAYSLLHNEGAGLLSQQSDNTDLSGPTLKPLGFGTKWIDVDNDGWPDLLFANGHVYDNTQEIDPLTTFRQPLMLFHNLHGKRFEDLVPALGGPMATELLGRGAATGDIDNDGRMDFLIVDFEGNPVLMHNLTRNPNHWITLDLRGQAPNHFAYGARVTAKAGKEIWTGLVSPASAYLSSSDPRLHFGLGAVTKLDSVTIRWSTGQIQTLHDVAADRILRVVQRQTNLQSHQARNP